MIWKEPAWESSAGEAIWSGLPQLQLQWLLWSMTPWVGHFEVITRSAHAHLMCHEPRRLQQESVFLTYIGFLSLASRPTLVPSQRPGRLPPLALSIHMRFFIWQATFRRQRVKRPIVSPNLFSHGVLVRISSLCTSQTKQPANSMKKKHG